MSRDDDPQDLKEAFAELHRRECADAPPFEAMRERAMNSTGARAMKSRSAAGRWLLWGAPTISAAALLLWLSGQVGAPAPAGMPFARTAQHVEQLLDSIEQQIETNEAIFTPTYATDALLPQINTDR
jgi:hypothetical protein